MEIPKPGIKNLPNVEADATQQPNQSAAKSIGFNTSDSLEQVKNAAPSLQDALREVTGGDEGTGVQLRTDLQSAADAIVGNRINDQFQNSGVDEVVLPGTEAFDDLIGSVIDRSRAAFDNMLSELFASADEASGGSSGAYGSNMFADGTTSTFERKDEHGNTVRGWDSVTVNGEDFSVIHSEQTTFGWGSTLTTTHSRNKEGGTTLDSETESYKSPGYYQEQRTQTSTDAKGNTTTTTETFKEYTDEDGNKHAESTTNSVTKDKDGKVTGSTETKTNSVTDQEGNTTTTETTTTTEQNADGTTTTTTVTTTTTKDKNGNEKTTTTRTKSTADTDQEQYEKRQYEERQQQRLENLPLADVLGAMLEVPRSPGKIPGNIDPVGDGTQSGALPPQPDKVESLSQAWEQKLDLIGNPGSQGEDATGGPSGGYMGGGEIDNEDGSGYVGSRRTESASDRIASDPVLKTRVEEEENDEEDDETSKA